MAGLRFDRNFGKKKRALLWRPDERQPSGAHDCTATDQHALPSIQANDDVLMLGHGSGIVKGQDSALSIGEKSAIGVVAPSPLYLTVKTAMNASRSSGPP